MVWDEPQDHVKRRIFPENFIDSDISGERNDSKSRMDNEESIEKNVALQQLDVGFASGDFEGTTTTGNILHGDKIKRSMREGENNGNFELQSNESTPSQTSTSANQEILSMEEVHFRESKAEKSSVPEARGDSETVLSDQPDQESIDNDSAIFSPLPKKSSVSSLPPCQIKLLMVQSRSHLHHRDHSRCQKKKSQIWQIRVQL